MLTKRIIAALDIKNSKVVKGINFENIKEAGDPIDFAKKYEYEGIDELVFLDISATNEKRKTLIDLIKIISQEISIPFTVGGGINNIDDIKVILNSGADKVFINSAAVTNPNLIFEASKIIGRANICVAVDTKRINNDDYVFINGGKINTNIKTIDWIEKLENLGAGEILLTSMNHDGTKKGFDCEMIKKINTFSSLPIIASGGAGKKDDFLKVFESGADGALAASIFHYNLISIIELKKYLKEMKINVRL